MKCNVCWITFSSIDKVYVTQCSHLICHDCASKCFSLSACCPICDTKLDIDDLALIELAPSAEKLKALCGLDPCFVLQIASRAIDFYNFQQELVTKHDSQEISDLKRQIQHISQKHVNIIKDLNAQINSLSSKLEATIIERNAQQKTIIDLQNKIEKESNNFLTSFSCDSYSSLEKSKSTASPGLLSLRDNINQNIHNTVNSSFIKTQIGPTPSWLDKSGADDEFCELLPETAINATSSTDRSQDYKSPNSTSNHLAKQSVLFPSQDVYNDNSSKSLSWKGADLPSARFPPRLELLKNVHLQRPATPFLQKLSNIQESSVFGSI
ncbi:uncharacterized protein LOC126323243 [Schistocerca gregaria]|uniref:uncharacterized protein LOC126323243 n=1 Tax=Schistocerca gregaria TaxID=7010 RepID=UPI00211E373F|nr:uncharacterized protein LOC126323243 [Schistocerca gregaria]